MRVRVSKLVLAMTMVLLAACSSNPPAPVMSTKGSTIVETGRVTDVRDVTIRGGRPSGVGSFIGTIIGGVAGSKIGSGTGSTVAGIGGAVAGGVAGQRVEEAGKSNASTELIVELDSGERRTFRVNPGEPYRIGDAIRITTVNGVSTVARY
ncbi:glycine zipper 2TM domain-containing protein [Noviherbaspirillum sp. ST9]|uniref:glycine zipper 2TM domain-containing protein n=1 Tax=Noviherbaspirillum sp. ST9 TaxID=3401606 RepID=UPI003B588C37